MSTLIKPNWPQPDSIAAFTTTRQFDLGDKGVLDNFNLALHVDDDPQRVAENRRHLINQLQLPSEPVWLSQVHGKHVVLADRSNECVEADASYSNVVGSVCAIQTADCLPVLFCNRQGTWVAATHAGWRGIQAGIIQATLACYEGRRDDLLAWLGPAIGPDAYEVGVEVYHAFLAQDSQNEGCFRESRPGHWYMDLYSLARRILNTEHVDAIYGGDYCTLQDADRFFSYRRDGLTGRMASLIWIKSE